MQHPGSMFATHFLSIHSKRILGNGTPVRSAVACNASGLSRKKISTVVRISSEWILDNSTPVRLGLRLSMSARACSASGGCLFPFYDRDKTCPVNFTFNLSRQVDRTSAEYRVMDPADFCRNLLQDARCACVASGDAAALGEERSIFLRAVVAFSTLPVS